MVKSIWKEGIVLICVWGVFLAACGTTAAASGNLQPCICTTPGANVYRNGTLVQVRELYSRSFSDPIGAKNEAFSLLIDQVQRWSSSVDIPVDNGNIIRITLTYLSPELTQLIILNQQLYKNIIQINEFEQMLQSKMNEIANREELIFLMTITYSVYDAPAAPEFSKVSINIPIGELALVNSRNAYIRAYDVDPTLRQEITISHGPSSGYIAFPIGVGSAENCTQIIEDRWNTIINVSIGRVVVNGTDYVHPLAWSVKYHPLVDMDNEIISPSIQFVAPQSIPVDYQPPPPERGIPIELEDPTYWELMSIHVWGYVTNR